MIYKIFNDKLVVEINSVGAELQSIKYDGVEYLWQGNPEFWKGRAYNLFPICGRLTDGKYTYKDNTYEMNLHGFLRKAETVVNQISDSEIDFMLTSNETIYASYPFEFEYHITFKLEGTKILMQINVTNHDDKQMYFSLGGHPGFNVPLDKGNFTDYFIEFGEGSNPYGIYMSDTCYTTNDIYTLDMVKNNTLPLKHNLFDRDAVLIGGLKAPLTLKSNVTSREVIVNVPKEMQYVGIWHAPKTEAPYVCIEPWTSVPAYDQIVDDLETKRDMFKIDKDETYKLDWSIEVK